MHHLFSLHVNDHTCIYLLLDLIYYYFDNLFAPGCPSVCKLRLRYYNIYLGLLLAFLIVLDVLNLGLMLSPHGRLALLLLSGGVRHDLSLLPALLHHEDRDDQHAHLSHDEEE